MDIEKCKCYYEILKVEKTASAEEIKKSYKKIILQYHPDKNSHLSEDEQKRCTNIFRQIQEAYECLIDERRRKWYDKNRVKIIEGKEKEEKKNKKKKKENKTNQESTDGEDNSESSSNTDGINIWEYFSNNCYEGFDDNNEKSFYNVYKKLFEEITKEENDELNRHYGKNGKEKIITPSFGNSKSCGKEIDEFYEYWSNFSTIKKFDYSYEYLKTFEQENRHVRRNLKKIAEKRSLKEKKEYNENIRSLIQYLKRHDTRYLNRVVEISEQKRKKIQEKEKQKREQMLRRKLLFYQNEVKREHTDQDQGEVEQEGEEAEEAEEGGEAEEGEEAELEGEANQSSADSCSRKMENKKSNTHNQSDILKGNDLDGKQYKHKSSNQTKENQFDKKNDKAYYEYHQEVINDNSYGEIIYRCEVCRKNFKSMKQYNSHEKSKKHKNNFLKHAKRYATGDIFGANLGNPRVHSKESSIGEVSDEMEDEGKDSNNLEMGKTDDDPKKEVKKSSKKEKGGKVGGINSGESGNSSSESSHLDEDILSWYRGKRRNRNKFVYAEMEATREETGEGTGEEDVSDVKHQLDEANPQQKEVNITDSSDDYESFKRKKKLLKKKKKKEVINRKENEIKNISEQKEDNKDIRGNGNSNCKMKESAKSLVCKMCKQTFYSRNKLFAHIQKEGHAANKIVADAHVKVHKNKKK
ncbi:hypothetical protein PGO_080430 [Plasmodium gonderi]|uniref:DnaJ protein n=1 Tax=Plasmodium gonderi TaxID=77519 RepID=A0A1Y1JD83_PLAGO|nr:hypothetical protein PGO_080430 [Plasmodium gonderi]GAW80479.1 hypothetical protein PGO_080430 [Plasmodium gonderi]